MLHLKSHVVPCVLMLSLASCGNAGVTDPPDGRQPIDPVDPGSPVSTPGQRMRTLDAVQVLVSALPGQDFAAETNFLVNTLKTIPQFADAGASADGTVWGQFTDGTIMFIVHAPPGDASGGGGAASTWSAGSLLGGLGSPASAASPVRVGSPLAAGSSIPVQAAVGGGPGSTARSPAAIVAPTSSAPVLGVSANGRAAWTSMGASFQAGPTTALPRAGTAEATLASALRRASSARLFPGGLPKSEKYRLFDAMGSYFVPDVRAEIAAMLDANGYRGTREPATIHALRSVAGDGIVYIRSHGGFGSVKRDGSTKDYYALWTATAAMDSTSEAADAQLLDDLKNHRIVYMLFRASRWSQALPVLSAERHYGITQDFVAHYMTFSDNSLVYVDACSSSVLPAFRVGFTTASAFFGWSERAAFQQMGPTAQYVFDRLLGANRFAAENPRQRPFEFDGLTFDPRFGKGKPYGSSRVVQDTGPIEAELTFHQLQGEFSLLAPSIWAVTAVESQNSLEILGSFGSDPGADGRVSIDAGSGPQQLTINAWAPNHIRADLPATGEGSYGNVVVEVRGHLSNARQLLAWEGTLAYTLAEAGTLTQRFELDIRVRVDPQDVRDKPGEAPKATVVDPFVHAIGMEARFEAAGSYSTVVGQCTATSEWAGHGTIKSQAVPDGTGVAYIYGGSVSKRRAALELVIAASHPSGLQLTGKMQCPTGSQSGTTPGAIGLDHRIHNESNGTSTILALPLDGALAIPGNSRQIPVPSMAEYGAQAMIRLSWSTIASKPAYDPDLAR